MGVKLKRTKPMQAAVVSHVGPYSEVTKLYQEIMKWLSQKRFQVTGPPFGWFYDNPEEVPARKLRSEVGFPFKGEAKSEGSITIKKIPSQEVLSAMHKGPYSEVGRSYNALFEYAKEKGFISAGCPIEIYLNDPAKVPEKEVLTEIQLPVKKK
jgi:effector-binding domain-containing protein